MHNWERVLEFIVGAFLLFRVNDQWIAIGNQV